MIGKSIAVVVASGGMDSCVSCAVAARDFDLAMFHLNYGQRTQDRELRAFNDQVAFFRPRASLVVDAHHFKAIGGSSLTDSSMSIPRGESRGGVPNTYVPFRNANILAMAVSWAEVIGASKVFIGAVEEDSSGYPDCRESFINAFNQAVREGTRPGGGICVEAPLLHLTKPEIVKLGMLLGAPFHLSWSCYSAQDKACGECESCQLRLKGFHGAGIPDPIPYVERPPGENR